MSVERIPCNELGCEATTYDGAPRCADHEIAYLRRIVRELREELRARTAKRADVDGTALTK